MKKRPTLCLNFGDVSDARRLTVVHLHLLAASERGRNRTATMHTAAAIITVKQQGGDSGGKPTESAGSHLVIHTRTSNTKRVCSVANSTLFQVILIYYLAHFCLRCRFETE